MSIIVNKEKKRKDISLSCRKLFLTQSIKEITIEDIAKTARIAKGSLYDYFRNKDDLVFEIMKRYIEDYYEKFDGKFSKNMTTRKKVFLLFDYFLFENNYLKRYGNIYKEYFCISVGTHNDEICKFNKECTKFIKTILLDLIKEGIKKGEILEQSINLVDGLLSAEKGFMIISWTERKDLNEELKSFLNTIFLLIEVHK